MTNLMAGVARGLQQYWIEIYGNLVIAFSRVNPQYSGVHLRLPLFSARSLSAHGHFSQARNAFYQAQSLFCRSWASPYPSTTDLTAGVNPVRDMMKWQSRNLAIRFINSASFGLFPSSNTTTLLGIPEQRNLTDTSQMVPCRNEDTSQT